MTGYKTGLKILPFLSLRLGSRKGMLIGLLPAFLEGFVATTSLFIEYVQENFLCLDQHLLEFTP
jgi:hypothetical protein